MCWIFHHYRLGGPTFIVILIQKSATEAECSRGHQCDITMLTRWWPSVLLLRLLCSHITKEVRGVWPLAHNRVHNIQHIYMKNNSPHNTVVTGSHYCCYAPVLHCFCVVIGSIMVHKRQVKRDLVDLVMEDYDITLCW